MHCEFPQGCDIGTEGTSGGGSPRSRVGRKGPRCFGLWLVIGIAVQPSVAWSSLFAQEDSLSSSGTNEVKIAISGNVTSGSKSFAIVDAGRSFERTDSVYYELVVSVHGRYGQSNGELMAKNWDVKASFDATPQATLSLFSFVGIEQNPIRKLTLRARMGTGAKWLIMRKHDKVKISLSGALLTAHEKHQVKAGQPGTSTWRWSLRLKTDLKVASKIDLNTTWFFQPRVDAVADYLVDGFVEVSQELTERVKLTLTVDYDHDSDPPKGVHESERRFLFGVTGRF